jgi:hypothetical protein
MSLAGIFHGNKAVVDRSVAPCTGDIAEAIVNGDFTIKRLFWTGTTYKLHPEDQAFHTIRFKEEEAPGSQVPERRRSAFLLGQIPSRRDDCVRPCDRQSKFAA